MSRLSRLSAVLVIYGLILRNNAVTGLRFKVNPNTVVLDTNIGGTVEVRCTVTDEQNVRSLNSLQINRLIANTWETLALLTPPDTASLSDSLPNDLRNKGLAVSGSYDPDNVLGTVVTLTIPRNNIQCSDARVYRCFVSYLDDNYNIHTVSMNDRLTAAELPVITSLVGKKNGYIIEGPSSSQQAAFNVGDELELTCTANIGNSDSTSIRWKQTSETSNEFIDYNPPSGTFTTGTAVSNGQCGYTRTDSIKYNTTNTDVNRPLNLAFECHVYVNEAPYNSYTTENNPMFYADVTGITTQSTSTTSTTAGITTQSTSTTSTTAGITIQPTTTTEGDNTTALIVIVIMGLTNLCTIVYATVLTVMLKRSRLSNVKHPSNRQHEEMNTVATYVNENLRMTGPETNMRQDSRPMPERIDANPNNYACLDPSAMDRSHYEVIQSLN